MSERFKPTRDPQPASYDSQALSDWAREMYRSNRTRMDEKYGRRLGLVAPEAEPTPDLNRELIDAVIGLTRAIRGEE